MAANPCQFISKPFHLGLLIKLIQKWKEILKRSSYYLFFSRLIFSLIVMTFIIYTPHFKDANEEYPLGYFVLCLFLFSLSSIIELTMFISSLSFNAKVSDELIGGTYMTLLATLGNLGGAYPSTLSLYLVDFFSVKYCSEESPQARQQQKLSTNSSSMFGKSLVEFNETIINSIRANTCSSKKISKVK
jgi:hypothetical protein